MWNLIVQCGTMERFGLLSKLIVVSVGAVR